MAATLQANNNGDGTVSVNIVGGVNGEVVDVYGSQFVSNSPVSAWVLFGTIVVGALGTGAGVYATGNGAYVFQGIKVGLPYGTAGRVNVANAATFPAVATACRAEMHARALALGLPFADIQQQLTPDETDIEYPGLILSPFAMAETSESALSGTQDVGYPTHFYIIDRENRYSHDLLPNYELWRQELVREYDGKQLDTVIEDLIMRVEYDTIIQVIPPKFEYLISEFTVRAVARMHR